MTPKAIVDWLEVKIRIDGAPCDIRIAIEQALLNHGLSATQAAEQIDRLRKKVVEEIEERSEDADNSGKISILTIRQQRDFIHGSCYVLAEDAEDVRSVKLSRLFTPEIYTRIQNLNFNEFEVFGQRLLCELGCDVARVTPHAGDQGIDFFGRLTVGGLLGANRAHLRLLHETSLIIVGQAKHYPKTTIGPATVRELVGAMSLARTKAFSTTGLDLFDSIELQPFSPVLALLISTGGFTKGSIELAQQAGLILFSGMQLAVFLADKGIGVTVNDKQYSFDPAAFDAWLWTESIAET